MPIGLGGLALGLNRRRRGFSPSLALNFLSQAIAGQYGTLDPRVSFSRASLATVTRSDGLVTWAGHNLILNSDDLTAASWSAANGTRTLVSDPTGQFGTVSQVAVPTTAFTFFTPSSNIGTNGPACFVMWVLGSASCTSLTAGLYDGASFGLLTGEIVSGPGTLTLQSSNTVAAITGLSTTAWTVVRISRTDAPTQVRPLIYPRSNSGANAGDVLFFRRFQLNLGTTPHPYYPTTAGAYNAPRFQFDPSGVTVTENYGANLVTNGTFDTNTTGWSAVAGATLASVGGQLEVANGSADFGYAFQSFPVTVGRTYMVTCSGRVGTTSMMRLEIGTSAGAQNLGALSFAAGTLETRTVYVTATTASLFLSAVNQTSTIGHTGYIDNVSVQEYLGTVTTGTATPMGLLVEEQRSNRLTWSRNYANAYWLKAQCSIVSAAGIALDGTATASALVEDSSNSSHPLFVTTGLSATSGTAETFSIPVKAVGRTQCRVSFAGAAFAAGNPRAVFDFTTGTVSSTVNGATGRIEPQPNGWFIVSVTATPGATGAMEVYIEPAVAGAVSYQGDGRTALLLDHSQLETGAFRTTIIPTFGATATRAPDLQTGTAATMGWNDATGTLVVDWTQPATPTASSRVVRVDSGSDANVAQVLSSPSQIIAALDVSSTNVVNLTTSQTAAGVRRKLAFAYSSGSSAASLNAGTPITGSGAFTPPAMTTLLIGHNRGNGQNLNGTIASLDYYPTRLPNQTLQTLTA